MELTVDQNGLKGTLHAAPSSERALVLTHGAGSNSNAPLLKAVSARLAEHNWTVFRCDLPFRQRHAGPPRPAEAPADREGLRQALDFLRQQTGNARLFLGGHSYGGRQASMLAAENPQDIQALLLLSYPLHPPTKPQQLRTAHLPSVHRPTFFAHGSRDDFGSPEEMREAQKIIPAPSQLFVVEGAGHDLSGGKKLAFLDAFLDFANVLERD